MLNWIKNLFGFGKVPVSKVGDFDFPTHNDDHSQTAKVPPWMRVNEDGDELHCHCGTWTTTFPWENITNLLASHQHPEYQAEIDRLQSEEAEQARIEKEAVERFEVYKAPVVESSGKVFDAAEWLEK